jgi:hypothetical protein
MATFGRIVPSKNQHKVNNFVFVRNTRWPSSTKNSSLNQRDNSKTSTNDEIKGFDHLIVFYNV